MMNIKEFRAQFSTEDACLTYLVEQRWPEGVTCPRCDSKAKIYKLAKPFRWVCKSCAKNGYRFSPIVGTIFENTNRPLTEWFQVIFYMCQSKKGVSALQIQRMMGFGSYETAWYMCHRVRAAMQNTEFMKLTGTVEVDETYIGGRSRNRHGGGVGGGLAKHKGGRGTAGKVAVIGAISRKGAVVAQVIEGTDEKTLRGFVHRAVDTSCELVASDEHAGYQKLVADGYRHESVNHTQGEYVRGKIHTGSIDSFWSLLKRGIMGSFHHVSKEYLPLYVNEFAFRNNYRRDPNMFGAVVRSA